MIHKPLVDDNVYTMTTRLSLIYLNIKPSFIVSKGLLIVPDTYHQVKDVLEWCQTIKKEYNALMNNNTDFSRLSYWCKSDRLSLVG